MTFNSRQMTKDDLEGLDKDKITKIKKML